MKVFTIPWKNGQNKFSRQKENSVLYDFQFVVNIESNISSQFRETKGRIKFSCRLPNVIKNSFSIVLFMSLIYVMRLYEFFVPPGTSFKS